MIWTVISTLLPWTTFGLLGALAYFVRRARKAEADAWDKTATIRDLGGQRDALRAQITTMRSQIDNLNRALAEAERRAILTQGKAYDVALAISNGGDVDAAHQKLMDYIRNP